MRIPAGLVFLIASVAATLATVVAAYALGAVGAGVNVFRTPIPYALLGLSFFIASPAYLLVRPVLRLRLPRFLLTGLGLGFGLFIWRGSQWNWHPAFLQFGNLVWLFSLPVVASFAYWSVLRALAPDLDD